MSTRRQFIGAVAAGLAGLVAPRGGKRPAPRRQAWTAGPRAASA